MAQIEEASPICRGKNLSWETILLFYNNMPREAMPKAQFHSFTESRINGWTQTHSQIARQLAFYYEKDGMCYPRFTREISYAELFTYMQNWAANYFIPNPYAPSLKGYKPTCIYRAVVEAIQSGESDFDKILDGIFGIQLSSHDKVKVYLSNFTNLLFDDGVVSVNDRASKPQLVMEPNEESAIDTQAYFDFFSSNSSSTRSNISSSLIFQSDDATQFVWECIKLFNKNKELKELFSSDYRANGGSMGNYLRINGCFVAQLGQNDMEGFESIYTDEEGYINNGFDARDIEKFAEAINDVYKGKYQVIIEGNVDEDEAIFKLIKLQQQNVDVASKYAPYLTALRTKPFMLLAGISGTGKSRIAREIAKACWPVGSKQRNQQVPDNFCMVQVKPNWHDSTELLGYVSRIGGEKYVTGDLLPFIAKAWENLSVPHILCLDEMNLAPVEQYFAEYLSVIESRRVDENGHITTDPIVKKDKSDWFRVLTAELTNDDNLRAKFLEEGISIPQNLFVVGTVNMDETTFSFSRKVLDRAMTIEMNEVDLRSSLSEKPEGDLGYISNILLSNAAKGTDVYLANQPLCDEVVKYLEKVNGILEGSPFKIAYRTRNEFMLYAVNRAVIEKESPLWKSLDEMTSMKILSRIEGDEERCKVVLNKLNDLLKEQFAEHLEESVSIKKVNEMIKKLSVGYTSYWT